ncbi:MAG: hypothetical protein U0353_25280 [Sandaracinus sp.]
MTISLRTTTALTLTLLASGCGGGMDTPDAASPTNDAFVPEGTDAAIGDDASTTSDAGAPGSDAAMACTPSGGPASGGGYCDLFELAVMTNGGSTEARLYGRLEPDGATGCVVVDEVEVLEGGTSIGTLAGVGSFDVGNPGALVARGPALPSMISRCAGDDERFDVYGLLVRGRYDGGTFEARCANAEGGSRWPPALHITCHENVDAPPGAGNGMVMGFMGTSFTSLYTTMPHGPGAAITGVDGTVHVIGHSASSFGAPMAPAPFHAMGFMASVGESGTPGGGPYSSITLSSPGDPFGAVLCPTPVTMPGPGTPPPPVFLLGITGTSERGPFSSEVYVNACYRTASP